MNIKDYGVVIESICVGVEEEEGESWLDLGIPFFANNFVLA